MIKLIIIITAGLFEAFISTLNSKFRQRSNELMTFITSVIWSAVWTLILVSVIENIKSFPYLIVYWSAYGYGDVLGLKFDKHIEKIAKAGGFNFKRKKKQHTRKR